MASVTCSVCGDTQEVWSIAPLKRPDLCGSCWIRNSAGNRDRKDLSMNENETIALAARETAAQTQEANAVKQALLDFPVQTKEQIETAGSILIDIKGRAKTLEERMQEITKPLNQALRSIRDLFRPALDAYTEAEVTLKRKIADAHLAIERANREAMLAAQAQLAQGNVHAAAQAATSMVERPSTDGVRTQEVWGYRVVNALEVPREFLAVDDGKVRAYIAQHKEHAKIPGIVVERDVRVIARRG